MVRFRLLLRNLVRSLSSDLRSAFVASTRLHLVEIEILFRTILASHRHCDSSTNLSGTTFTVGCHQFLAVRIHLEDWLCRTLTTRSGTIRHLDTLDGFTVWC